MNILVIFLIITGTVLGQDSILQEISLTFLPNLFKQMDSNLDGFLSLDELQTVFAAMDTNHDDGVTEYEFYQSLIRQAPTLWRCAKHFFASMDIKHHNLIKESSDVDAIYKDFDENGNGQLAEEEFVRKVTSMATDCKTDGHLTNGRRFIPPRYL